ncbi:hypothetical protein [Methylobacterium sp. NEAU K]|uniref:hypothetical protein n=1 Tax=Methylobacterium sp. NEAU K TaxID=3064946 RepID=UPI00273483B5|nr:hypothetical protein [Methylobacterium sp. NEAU K]MDP4006502.1 hypothetical protein [Methylobacterium sp. NEAU K]
MPVTYTLARALTAKVGACVEITLEADDGTQFRFAATPEQADELAEDLEAILDDAQTATRTPHPGH